MRLTAGIPNLTILTSSLIIDLQRIGESAVLHESTLVVRTEMLVKYPRYLRDIHEKEKP